MKNIYPTILFLFFAQIAFAQFGGGGGQPTCEQEGFPPGSVRWFRDADDDGYGDPNVTTCSASQPFGYVSDSSDCDDTDDNLPSSDHWVDSDGDGYGDPNQKIPFLLCTVPNGYATNGDDCNDTEGVGATVYPGAPEICDGLDNDCDGLIDENTVATPTPVTVTPSGCGQVTLSHNGPSSWYWQTISTGVSQTDNDNPKVVTSGSKLYLRAKSGNCWSNPREVTFSTVQPSLNEPDIIGTTERCGNGSISVRGGYLDQNGRVADSFRWYSATGVFIGETQPSAYQSFNLSQTSTNYQLEAIIDGCISPKKNFTLTVNPLPSTPTISVNQSCDVTNVSMLNPPAPNSTIKWYWQTGANDVSTNDADLSKNFTSPGTVYLRSYNESTGCWGASGQETFSIMATPAVPLIQDISINQGCTSTTLAYNTADVPANTDWYWQSTADDVNTNGNAGLNSIELFSSGTYFIRAKSGNCWSAALPITYNLGSDGILAPQIPSQENQGSCGPGTFNYTPAYITQTGQTGPSHYVWYDANDVQIDEVAVGTPFTRTLSTTTIFKVAAKINGCTGPKTLVTATVYSVPSDLTLGSAIGQITENCNQTVITRNAPPNGFNWFWQTTSNGEDDSPQAEEPTLEFTTYENLFLRPRNEATGCWGNALEVPYTVKQSPAVPNTTIQVNQSCNSVTLTRDSNPPNGTTWYWQSEAFGEEMSGDLDNASIELFSGTEYFLRAFSNGCWSATSLRKSYTTGSNTVVPPTVTEVAICGPGDIVLMPEYNGPVLSGVDPDVTYNFYTEDGTFISTVPFGGSFADSITETTIYQVGTMGNACESSRTLVTATVNIPDTIYYLDFDGDGLGDPFSPSALECAAPENYVDNNLDNCPNFNDPTNACPDAIDTNATHNPDNYIYTRTYQVGRDSALSNFFVPSNEVIQEIAYFDGLGRPRQQIAIDQTPDKNDLVTHIGFDGFNRTHRQWLPYEEATDELASYRFDAKSETDSWYLQEYAEDLNPSAPNPFSQTYFEPSPLNRVLKQGAPGQTWLVNPSGADNTIAFDYQSNSATEVKKYYVTTDNSADTNTFVPSLAEDGFYGAAELTKTVTYDENHSGTDKDHSTEEFVDKQGRVLLERTYDNEVAHDTYYVYDDYGNLTYVLPPLVDTSDGVSANELAALCYQYTYDHRNRIVVKQLPGKEKEYIVYNKLDLPIMTQDANQRVNNEWLFTKYDAFGRVAYTGKATVANDISRTDVQQEVDGLTTAPWVGRTGQNNFGSADVSYNDGAYPTLLSTVAQLTEILTITYYDDYGFDRGNEPNPPSKVFDEDLDERVKGMATGSKVKVLGTNAWTTTVNRYNYQGHLIYTYSENGYLGSVDLITTKIDFVGRPLIVRSAHNLGITNVVTLDNFTYDHVGRLLTQTQCIGDSALGNTCPTTGGSGTTVEANLSLSGTITTDQVATMSITAEDTATISGTVTLRIDPNANNGNSAGQELIVSNSYDELGQLQRKKVGGDATGNGLQTVDYKYNIRGWLKSINDVDNLNADPSKKDLFAFNIGYDQGANPLYNGNISQTQWRTDNDDSSLKSYGYTYDALNRITSATDNMGRFGLSGVQYDKNGNITDLSRQGHLQAMPDWGNNAHFGTMDDLNYQYFSGTNRLRRVTDAVTANATSGMGEFVDRNPEGDDYGYDDNGNMTSDANKGITSITYNHLNLPTTITIANEQGNGTISYIYDATGVKLKKVMGLNQTIYAGNYIYTLESNAETLQFFNHPEGYISTENGGYGYVYQYTDHLGNVRLTYADSNNDGSIDPSTEIISEKNYYPFGLEHKGYNSAISPNVNGIADEWRYNGKELNEELGLDWYDFGARNYDASLGRWMNIDPLAEQMRRHSPYNYAFNNPIFFIDPDGMSPYVNDGIYIDKDGNKVGEDSKGASDGKVYVVQGSSKRKVQKATDNGKTIERNELDESFELPANDVKKEHATMVAKAKSDNDREFSSTNIEQKDGTTYNHNVTGEEYVPGENAHIDPLSNLPASKKGIVKVVAHTHNVDPSKHDTEETTYSAGEKPSPADYETAAKTPHSINVVLNTRKDKVFIIKANSSRNRKGETKIVNKKFVKLKSSVYFKQKY
ncbi:DUF6443 domain-containing protein [Croceitalea sp. MTPC5]|uniref:DUF6443 domain-containing protein n=1 Tax=Croceitalea sp. MTPC5 TaxID=3056565 RepID=UPI0030CAB74B